MADWLVFSLMSVLMASRLTAAVQMHGEDEDEANNADMIEQLHANLSAKYDAKLESLTIQLNTVLATTNAALKTVETDLQSTKAELESVKSDLQTKTGQLKNITNELAKMATDVSFEVTASVGNLNATDFDILQFGDIIENRGNAYDVSSGKFTAPLSGTFLFWVHVFNNDSVKRLAVYIVKEKNSLIRAFAPDNLYGGVASATVLVHLEKGERVWLETQGSSHLYGHHLSSYGGTLLRSDD